MKLGWPAKKQYVGELIKTVKVPVYILTRFDDLRAQIVNWKELCFELNLLSRDCERRCKNHMCSTVSQVRWLEAEAGGSHGMAIASGCLFLLNLVLACAIGIAFKHLATYALAFVW